MKTYTLKHIDAQGGVIDTYTGVTDIQILGHEVDLFSADGHETAIQILSDQRFEMKRQ